MQLSAVDWIVLVDLNPAHEVALATVALSDHQRYSFAELPGFDRAPDVRCHDAGVTGPTAIG